MKNKISIILLCLLVAQAQLLTAQTKDITESSIDAIFSDQADLSKPGATVAVVSNGELVFSKGYGSANLEYAIPNTPSTIFHVASVSKQFTAFSILLLADQGLLSFDDDIRKHIPEVPDFGKTITLRHLASHTSGLRDQWNLLALAGWRLDDVITKEQVMKLVEKQQELNFDPGEQYAYCNTGFTLLAEVIARVSGKSFAEFTKSEIFDPLGMENTLFYDDHERIVKHRAYSYYTDSTGYKKAVLSYANVGATSLFTTVEDISRWAINFSTPLVGNKAIIDQFNSLAVLNNGETFGGAYGQFVGEHNGHLMIQHGGSDAGYRTFFARFPDDDLAVAVFSNYGYTNPNVLALQVADLYLEEKAGNVETKAKDVKFIKLKAKELAEFEGYYWNDPGMYSRRIYVKDDTLRYYRGENNESPLVPIGSNTFKMINIGNTDLKVTFLEEDGKRQMSVVQDDAEPNISYGYEPVANDSLVKNELEGKYYSEELETSYVLKVKDGLLKATHIRHDDVTLTPIMKDRFETNRWYFGTVEFQRNDQGTVNGFLVSTGRMKNLQFSKGN
ncbi:MAG: serine hydrolase domain-containing protein [Cyclobacteriaceae bacterium]